MRESPCHHKHRRKWKIFPARAQLGRDLHDIGGWRWTEAKLSLLGAFKPHSKQTRMLLVAVELAKRQKHIFFSRFTSPCLQLWFFMCAFVLVFPRFSSSRLYIVLANYIPCTFNFHSNPFKVKYNIQTGPNFAVAHVGKLLWIILSQFLYHIFTH